MAIKSWVIRVQTCLIVVYFLGTPLRSILMSLVGEIAATFLVNVTIGSLLVMTALRRKNKLLYPILIYSFVAVFMLLTIIIHPEYEDWYLHSNYGIATAFLDLRSGITAFLIFSLYDDEESLKEDLKIASVFVFAAYFFKYLQAQMRGYWVIGTVGGGQYFSQYDMEFGYRMLFPAAYFGGSGILENNKKQIAFYLICLVFIFTDGSRGPALWAMFVLPLALVFKYRSMTLRQKRAIIGAAIFAIVAVALIYLERDAIYNVVVNMGIQSRTILSLLSGSFGNANGRDIIYGMALELIDNGGPFGHGFYGDRPYIGTRFSWGYSHNIFLELFVQFGYLGGAIISLVLLWNVIKLFKKCIDKDSQIIFVTIFICAMRLLVSNSFWYESWFWAMIALFFWFNRKPQSIN